MSKQKLVQGELFSVCREPVRVKGRRRSGSGRHSYSLASYGEMSAQVEQARKAQIVEWLRKFGPANDRMVRDGLYPGADMNMVRPRITELLDAGALRECGGRVCPETGRTVRMVAVTGG